jgi:hypothetical protein
LIQREREQCLCYFLVEASILRFVRQGRAWIGITQEKKHSN